MHCTKFVQKSIFSFYFGEFYVESINMVNEIEGEILQEMMVLLVCFTVFLLTICVIYRGQ